MLIWSIIYIFWYIVTCSFILILVVLVWSVKTDQIYLFFVIGGELVSSPALEDKDPEWRHRQEGTGENDCVLTARWMLPGLQLLVRGLLLQDITRSLHITSLLLQNQDCSDSHSSSCHETVLLLYTSKPTCSSKTEQKPYWQSVDLKPFGF